MPSAGTLQHSLIGELAKRLSPSDEDRAARLKYDWYGREPGHAAMARASQLPPGGDWRIWLLLAGRGFGKTRTGAEWVREQIESGACRRMALVAPTAADARDVMVEGESGIMAVCPPWNRPLYEPSKRRLTWRNGAMAVTYSADEPARLRGPQHDGAWADELLVWRFPESWDMLLLGLRLGKDPRCVVTATPRPTPLCRHMLTDATVAVVRGTTYENLANLAPAFAQQIIGRYEGTRLGRQELHGEILDDVEGALWTREMLEATRIKAENAPPLVRIVIGVDPAATSGPDADETGIIAAGIGGDGQGYVLDDRSLRASPYAWGSAAVTAYHARKADRLVAEQNNGGEMVELTVRTVDPNVSYKAVHASRGKITRAEPVAALYEQGRVHHVGYFAELEDQLCGWTPGSADSPDRLDALVWALTELMLVPVREPSIRAL